MATQVAVFANTIMGMKKAVKRKAYDSDSDSSIDQSTNRGNKLRKKARFVREGQLAPPNGSSVYKKTVTHAGYERDVVSINPPLLDEDGYEIDSADDDEVVEGAMAEAADMDPYARISIEQLLAPLTSAADLPNHPTLSKPFTSKTLSELTRQAGEMVQKEKESLWSIKQLLTRMSGDNSWIPCGITEAYDDFDLFLSERDREKTRKMSKAVEKDHERGTTPVVTTNANEQPVGLVTTETRTIDSQGVEQTQVVQMLVEEKDNSTVASTIIPVEAVDSQKEVQVNGFTDSEAVNTEGNDVPEQENADTSTNNDAEGGMAEDQETEDIDVDDDAGAAVPRRMRTRAQAQAASDSTPIRTRSVTPESTDGAYIHPYFIASQTSRPDRDQFLPGDEAEECRRLLQLYIQKQEEVCRGAQKVYDGLLRAERHRKDVFKWCKAEGHIGLGRDMSDGEDWYDKEEWNLDEDLKKGQDEEEEDATTTAKKTRARRQ